MLSINLIFEDGETQDMEVHELVVRDEKCVMYTRTGEIVLARDESDEKW